MENRFLPKLTGIELPATSQRHFQSVRLFVCVYLHIGVCFSQCMGVSLCLYLCMGLLPAYVYVWLYARLHGIMFKCVRACLCKQVLMCVDISISVFMRYIEFKRKWNGKSTRMCLIVCVVVCECIWQYSFLLKSLFSMRMYIFVIVCVNMYVCVRVCLSIRRSAHSSWPFIFYVFMSA